MPTIAMYQEEGNSDLAMKDLKALVKEAQRRDYAECQYQASLYGLIFFTLHLSNT